MDNNFIYNNKDGYYLKNKIAKDLFTSKYRKRVVKPKKVREVSKKKKIVIFKSSPNYLNYF